MKGVILDLGSDGSFSQFPYTGAIHGVYGPMELVDAGRLMEKNGGRLVAGQEDEWTVGERDSLGRTFRRIRFVFMPLEGLEALAEKIRRLKS